MFFRCSRILSLALLLALLAACGGTVDPTTTRSVDPTATFPSADLPTVTATGEAPAITATPEATAPAESPEPEQLGGELTVMTHDSFSIGQAVLDEFQRQTGAKVTILESGDAGEVLNKAILSKASPIADVLYGVDNTFFSRALEADIFEPYAPVGLDKVKPTLHIDSQQRLIPIDYGYVSLNYHKAGLEQAQLAVPEKLEDITRPEYKGKLVVENPARSSPGLAFLIATVSYFGDEGEYTWREFWRDLRANDVLVVDGWETAYYSHFSGATGSSGSYPLVVSYATSPAAEVYFSEGKLSEPPTGNILPPNGSFLQIEFAGILKGTRNLALAKRWMDFMLTPTFQEDIPLNMFVYPALGSAAQPEVFEKFAQVPDETSVVGPELIAQNRERWIQEWTEIVLQ